MVIIFIHQIFKKAILFIPPNIMTVNFSGYAVFESCNFHALHVHA